MDTASMYQGLTFLAWTSVVFLVVIGCFLVKVLIDLSKLLASVGRTANLIETSAKPILADVEESVSIINKFVKKTENNINKLKNISTQLGKLTAGVMSKTSALSGILFKAGWNFLKTLIKK